MDYDLARKAIRDDPIQPGETPAAYLARHRQAARAIVHPLPAPVAAQALRVPLADLRAWMAQEGIRAGGIPIPPRRSPWHAF